MSLQQLHAHIAAQSRKVEKSEEEKRAAEEARKSKNARDLNKILETEADAVSAALLKIVKDKAAKGEKEEIELAAVYPGFGRFFTYEDEEGLMWRFGQWLKERKLDNVFTLGCMDGGSPWLYWWRMPKVKE